MAVRVKALILIAFITVITAAGCSRQASENSEVFGIYYINNEQTGIIKVPYRLTGKSDGEQIREINKKLCESDKNSENSCAVPDGVSIAEYDLSDNRLSLYFNRAYYELSGTREALLRAAVVRTFLQLDYVYSVSFFVAEDPLTDLSGKRVGEMTDESFLMSFGAEEEAPESGTFVLYYASLDGKKLVKKQRAVYYNNNLMAEEVVLRNLSRYPDGDNSARPALSESTKILAVTTRDGICYVDLDSSFLNQGNNVSTDVAVYAIVNSLCALENVNKVQIIINNEEEGLSKGAKTVSGLYEADPSLVRK